MTLPLTLKPPRPRSGRPRADSQGAPASVSTKRYRIHLFTLTVVREAGAPDPRILGTPLAVAELMREVMPDDDREHFWGLALNAQNGLIEAYHVSTGTLSASLVHPREVFKPALIRGAASLILVHNHPSGDSSPSREDVRLTRQLAEGAKLLDLRIHDHVIIGNGSGRSIVRTKALLTEHPFSAPPPLPDRA